MVHPFPNCTVIFKKKQYKNNNMDFEYVILYNTVGLLQYIEIGNVSGSHLQNINTLKNNSNTDTTTLDCDVIEEILKESKDSIVIEISAFLNHPKLTFVIDTYIAPVMDIGFYSFKLFKLKD